LREPFYFGRRREKLHFIPQPLHYRAADEHAPLESVFLVPNLCAGGRDEPVGRVDHALASVQQHEAAGAVGVLRHAGPVAGLAEQRRLLVAGDAAMISGSPSTLAGSMPKACADGCTSGSRARGTPRSRISSSSQSPRVMSNSMVREAFEDR